MLQSFFDTDFINSMIKLVIALTLSGLIGLERELNRHFAGLRTHILVGVSACLMMLLSVNGFTYFMENYDNVRFDPARIPSYVISGVGFLGAGTILISGRTIRGLTTAASIWSVAGLGLVIGIGMYKEAIFTTIIILISLVLLNKVEKIINSKQHNISFEINLAKENNPGDFLAQLQSFPMEIREYDVISNEDGRKKIKMYVEVKQRKKQLNLHEWLLNQHGVEKIKMKFK